MDSIAEKPYRLGLIVGRFQAFHAGHRGIIDLALALCGRVGVFIGSSQESGTTNNPFTYETRAAILRAVYGDALEIHPLPDIGVGNTSKWGDYVLDRALERFGELPDVMISGKEGRRADWLDSERGARIAELYVPKTVDISATRMRELLLENDFEQWKKFADPALWEMFGELRAAVLESRFNLETGSV